MKGKSKSFLFIEIRWKVQTGKENIEIHPGG